MSLSELTNRAAPSHLDFLRALQLGHFLKSMPHPRDPGQPLMTFEEYCSDMETLPHTLLLTYNLLNMPPDDFQPPGIARWEWDLNQSFNPRQ